MPVPCVKCEREIWLHSQRTGLVRWAGPCPQCLEVESDSEADEVELDNIAEHRSRAQQGEAAQTGAEHEAAQEARAQQEVDSQPELILFTRSGKRRRYVIESDDEDPPKTAHELYLESLIE